MDGYQEEKEHLVPEKQILTERALYLEIFTKQNRDDALNFPRLLKNREICKSMEHFEKVSGDDCKLLGHAFSKSSSYIQHVQYDDIIYQELKKGNSKSKRKLTLSANARFINFILLLCQFNSAIMEMKWLESVKINLFYFYLFRSEKSQCNCFEDSSSLDDVPAVHMQHKNGQVFLSEPISTSEVSLYKFKYLF